MFFSYYYDGDMISKVQVFKLLLITVLPILLVLLILLF